MILTLEPGAAGVAIVDAHGDEMASALLPVVERHLERTAAASDARYDQVREGAVILLGTIGGHLQTGDAKVGSRSIPPATDP